MFRVENVFQQILMMVEKCLYSKGQVMELIRKDLPFLSCATLSSGVYSVF